VWYEDGTGLEQWADSPVDAYILALRMKRANITALKYQLN
jgi:hypothetical protein